MAEQHQNIVWKYADSDMAAGSAEVIRTLHDHGYEAYWVGGCVRDEYMGRQVSDMDITTSALPEVTCSIFPRVIPTGIKHGTVTVLVNGQSFEVTTYRIESGYEDHRRPAQVVFVSEVEEDLRRRDFTMNAMALGIGGSWVDPYDGRRDIDLRIIRCVGDATVRFREDALRMIRCIRFASIFGFSIAKDTWKGILAVRDTLPWIAIERIRAELDKMMAGPDPLRGLGLLKKSGLYTRMKIPFPYAMKDPVIINAIPAMDSSHLDIRWAMLILGFDIPGSEAEKLLREWTFSNQRKAMISGLLSFQEAWFSGERGNDIEADRLLWIQLVLKHGAKTAESWLCMHEAVNTTGKQHIDQNSLVQARRWLEEMPVQSLKDLTLTGNEILQALNRRGGPWMGKVLQQLLFQTAAGLFPNERDRLIEEAKQVIEHEEE
ncbi:CCA tRNA nucleotidyltransferase [Paenibacillus dakarensis]|uniref:CCA tRNA nucleotidyltransferase n=1 Tax=Paenibacillus dakarensis TaxID=1527293 RepID=UPI0006D52BDB|nr:CCA tRNA nucleotidyltransferase [Paenibacillus dakarensis]